MARSCSAHRRELNGGEGGGDQCGRSVGGWGAERERAAGWGVGGGWRGRKIHGNCFLASAQSVTENGRVS